MKTLQIRTFIGLNSSKDQQIRETARKSIPCLYYRKSGDILQEEKYFFIKLQA